MRIVHALTRKPWTTAQSTIDNLHEGGAFRLPKAKVGLRTLMCVITVVFSVLIVIYTERMGLSDWRPLSEPWLLWLNTVILIASSAGMQWAWVSARRSQTGGVRAGLRAGGIAAIAFLVGQVFAWDMMIDAGYFAAANPSNAFFYMITGLHGVHLIGGLLALGWTSAKVWRGVDMGRVRLSIELCTNYWHFLLLVWLVMFGLMLGT